MPMRLSPLANTMRRLAKVYPEMTLDECREWARRLHCEASARKRYSVIVLSPEQQRKRQRSLDRLRNGPQVRKPASRFDAVREMGKSEAIRTGC
jgi:hypothetical protein